MNYACINTRAVSGTCAIPAKVEVFLSNGLVGMTIVGLAETSVRESRERVRAALMNSGFEFPQKRVTVNLSPADVPKHGGGFDLPIALGLLLASGQLIIDDIEDYEAVGELTLDGGVRANSGLLVVADACRNNQRVLITANQSEDPLELVPGLRLISSAWLRGLVEGIAEKRTQCIAHQPASQQHTSHDMRDIKGQTNARHALEIAAAGGHGLLMIGPPGSGKSMLAATLPGILPPPSADEELAVAKIWSVAGAHYVQGNRVFRAPHHSASTVAVIGGGAHPTPGEISLAHNGVLFLDELGEFSPHLLDTLREPMETGQIELARANWRTTFPSQPHSIVAASNPCKCGYAGYNARCTCSPGAIERYQNKISGPLYDRFDIRIDVLPVEPALLFSTSPNEDSQTVRQRVIAAHQRQFERQGMVNARLKGAALDQAIALDSATQNRLATLLIEGKLTPRGIVRIKRIALTIHDLCNAEKPITECIMQAVNLRNR